MQRLIVILMIIFGTHYGLKAIYSTSEDDLDESWSRGQRAGFKTGKEEGRAEGYNDGLSAGISRSTTYYSVQSVPPPIARAGQPGQPGRVATSGRAEACSSDGGSVQINGKSYRTGSTGCVRVGPSGKAVAF